MFLITVPGERHEDHIPIILVENYADAISYVAGKYPRSGLVVFAGPECFEISVDEGEFTYNVLYVEIGKEIPRT
jgi:hypothetical protein